MSFKSLTPRPAVIQFGNDRDSYDYMIVTGELLGEISGAVGAAYLIRNGKTYGRAIKSETISTSVDGPEFYCTAAMTLGKVFYGKVHTPQDLANFFKCPVEVFV